MHACHPGPSRNTTSRDQAPSHLAGTQMAHGTASRKQVGQGPYSLPPSPPCMTQHRPPLRCRAFLAGPTSPHSVQTEAAGTRVEAV